MVKPDLRSGFTRFRRRFSISPQRLNSLFPAVGQENRHKRSAGRHTGSLRVAAVVEQFWHRVPGGVATTARDSLAALRELGRPDLDLIGVAARHGAAGSVRSPIGMAHLPLPRLALYESWHVLRRPGVETATGAVDVIHATGLAIPPRTAPLVVTMHDLAVLVDRRRFSRKGARFLDQSIALARRDADLIVVPSTATQRACIDAGFDPERLRVIPWGVTSSVVSLDVVDAVRARFGLEDQFVLFVGTQEPRKNLAGLIRAMALIDPVPQLIIAGPAGWNQRGEEDERHHRILDRLSDRIRFIGHVSDAERDALYSSAAVTVYPSLLEGFGLPVLEAMGHGSAVVTSATTSTAEVAGDVGVLVDPLDDRAIAEAVSALLADPDRARELGELGRVRAAEYTWEATAKATYDVYRELVP